MAEDILKRINEILEQGIKATGIDADPTDTSKYGFAPEHGSLIRELEELELLEELQELVGGEEKLGELITSIAFKQEEVSPRYQTQEFQNFNVEGEPIGKRAYGITTAELQQKEIQDLIKNFIDTPTNVVDDFYVVPPDKLQEAVNLVKNDPRYALDINAMHKDYLEMLENAIVETGFIGDTDTRGGLYADLDVVLEDWLSEGGDLEGNKFFNNSPTWDNLPDTQNVRGLIASAGGPGNITPGYKMPQYFKDQENVPYKTPDAPTQGKVIETAEDLQEYVDPQAVNKVEEFASKFPDKFKQIVKVAGEIPKKALTAAQVLDPGDIVITQGLRTLLPRLGAAAIAPAALTAYVAYELSVLAVDAANALEKAAEKQGLAQFGDNTDVDWKQLGKDTWSEFGDVSDTWSLSWKISEPMINWAFDKISSYNGEQ